jgi:hypothetical protein
VVVEWCLLGSAGIIDVCLPSDIEIRCQEGICYSEKGGNALTHCKNASVILLLEKTFPPDACICFILAAVKFGVQSEIGSVC